MNPKSNKNYNSLDDSELVVKPVSCFDVNANDRLICAGTDELNHNVYLLFFDIRERRLMGGFFESHQEEVTGEESKSCPSLLINNQIYF